MIDFTRNYKVTEKLNDIAEIILSSQYELVPVDCESHYGLFENKELIVKFWDSNKYYAWFGSGTIIFKFDDEKTVHWHNELPSRKFTKKLIKLFEKSGVPYLSGYKKDRNKLKLKQL